MKVRVEWTEEIDFVHTFEIDLEPAVDALDLDDLHEAMDKQSAWDQAGWATNTGIRERQLTAYQLGAPERTVIVTVDVESATLEETWRLKVPAELEGDELADYCLSHLADGDCIDERADNETGRTIQCVEDDEEEA